MNNPRLARVAQFSGVGDMASLAPRLAAQIGSNRSTLPPCEGPNDGP